MSCPLEELSYPLPGYVYVCIFVSRVGDYVSYEHGWEFSCEIRATTL
jgi:hypothetical protein